MPSLHRPSTWPWHLIATFLLATTSAFAATPTISQATGPTVAPAPAAAEADVTETLNRYARAWYEGNATLMATQLHPEFTRTTVRRNAARPDAVDVTSGLALIDMTDRGFGRLVQPSARKHEVSNLKVDGGRASAMLVLADRTEMVNLVRWNNQWRVVQVLTERNEP